MKQLIALAFLALTPLRAWTQASPRAAGSPPSASAVRTAAAPQIDGRLDDAAWTQAPVIGGFTQRDPQDGEPASEATEVRIMYDDGAIYVGARLHDRQAPTSRLASGAALSQSIASCNVRKTPYSGSCSETMIWYIRSIP